MEGAGGKGLGKQEKKWEGRGKRNYISIKIY